VRTSLVIVWLVTAGLNMARAEPFDPAPAMAGGAAPVRPETVPARVRSAGLSPATLPVRVGSTYVMRAVDERGRMFRVVAASNTGDIVAVRPAARTARSRHERAGKTAARANAASKGDRQQTEPHPVSTMPEPLAPCEPPVFSVGGLSVLTQLDNFDGRSSGYVLQSHQNSTKDDPNVGLVLTLGRLSTNPDSARQVLAIENKTSRSFSAVGIECGFYAGNRLVGNGYTAVDDLAPGSLAHSSVLAVHANDADNVKCRIKPR
jgi:hypothetical protein